MAAGRPVIAIAIDAAEGRLVHRLAAEGHVPAIARLVSDGRLGTVRSPAGLGSGAVWPTFVAGEGPDRHGLFGEWAWDPAAMRLQRPSFEHLDPFWRRLADAGVRVAVVDVPFAPIVGHERLAEVADWGAHDWLGGATVVEPAALRESLADLLSVPHPLVAGHVDSDGPGDVEGLRHVARSLVAGARQRGDLALRLLDVVGPDLLIVVFTEVHRASHLLWHTIDADHPAWQEGLGELPADVMSGLVDVFRAIDAQVARLLAHAGPDAVVVLFALHGMQPARGIPALLGDVLERWGFAVRRRWWQQSAGETLGALVKGVKAWLPGPIKAAYYRRVPRSVTMRLAQPSMPVPAWDWSRTRAFSLPTDQHGWIRINLAGRESQGIVSPSSYDEVCRELAQRLASLAGPEGPLVREVIVTAAREGGPPARLPDLVVHWAPSTWRPRLRVLDPPIDSIPVGLKFVAQHADDGFFVARGAGVDDWPPVVEAGELGRRLGHAVGVPDA
jgi:predicted AlkP superfamily phosphohydrolase/phosphomutase